MGAMVYLALDKKSNFATRVASLIALGIMILTIAICLFLIFTDNRVPVDESVLIVGAPVETVKDENNITMELLLLVIFMAGIFTWIVILAMKENKKQMKKDSEAKPDAPKNFKF
jgi:amino acid transporter